MTFSKSAGGGRAPVRYSFISLPWSPAGAAPTLAVRSVALVPRAKVSWVFGRTGTAVLARSAVGVSALLESGRRGATGGLRTSMEDPGESFSWFVALCRVEVASLGLTHRIVRRRACGHGPVSRRSGAAGGGGWEGGE